VDIQSSLDGLYGSLIDQNDNVVSFEGLNLNRRDRVVERDGLMRSLWESLQTHKLLNISAPFLWGKTSTFMLLGEYINKFDRAQENSRLVVSVSCLWLHNSRTIDKEFAPFKLGENRPESFEELWIRSWGLSHSR
jgi:hypothetical protein